MTGVLLQEIKSGYFTNMKEIFDALDNVQIDYNWLITDYECNDYPSDGVPYNQEYVWISGRKLTEIINNHNIQFIWGVLSGFAKDISVNEVMKYQLPFANGNSNLWSSNINIQHSLAEIEIVSWDSSLLLMISKSDDLVAKLKKAYPKATDLAEYNAT